MRCVTSVSEWVFTPCGLAQGKKGAGGLRLPSPHTRCHCEARFHTVIPGGDPESRKCNHLKLLCISAFAGMTGKGDGAFTNDGLQVFYRVILEPWTGGIKGDTPLIPRFKGVSPL